MWNGNTYTYNCGFRQENRNLSRFQVNKSRCGKMRRLSRKPASEGMTAAIILIAFIITAAGISFVILTMGSNMQQQLGTTGARGLEQASSAMHNTWGLQMAQN